MHPRMEKNTDRYSSALECPFCGQALEPPAEVKAGFETFEGGRCACGAVYVYDRTGRKLGEAMMEALLLINDGDYDKAFSAEEGGYEEEVVTFYERLGRFAAGRDRFGERAPKFYFLRRKPL